MTELRFRLADVVLPGSIEGSPHAEAIVVFAHGSGSSRLSPRNRAVAAQLQQAGFATVLFDLLTEQEGADRGKVFDIPLLARRLAEVVDQVRRDHELPVGLFGASTGAAAALDAAAARPDAVGAVVSRGGRPDLASNLTAVTAPTLLIVGGHDLQVLELNREAAARLTCPHEVEIVPGAGHLFEGPGQLETVATLAERWFTRWLITSGVRQR